MKLFSPPVITPFTFITILIILCYAPFINAQEIDVSSANGYHNQLFFNRYLINPTFSLVRENKSYLNILHRNQYSTFEDNSQNYYLGFSNLINENTALGIGVYSQWSGVVQQFGFNANYATAVQLGAKSKLTFGANITYYNEGVDKNRIVALQNDQQITNAKKESKLAIQPGMALSIGKFDVGIYATELVKYNQSTNEFSTNLNTNNLKGSLQYTHGFTAKRGLFKDARLLPLIQVGENNNRLSYMGSFLLDMPSYGWVQSTYDTEQGISAGVGFNLSKKMSLGYLLEKNVANVEANLGWNHELSLAYTFKDNSAYGGAFTENSSQDQKIEGIVRNYEEQILQLIADKKELVAENEKIKENKILKEQVLEKEKVQEKGVNKKQELVKTSFKEFTVQPNNKKDLAYENKLVLDALILRQDSIENARKKELEERFTRLARIVKTEIHRKKTTAPKTTLDEKYHSLGIIKNISNRKTTKPLNIKETKDYIKLPIKVLNQENIVGVESGYYVIANVYKTKKYLDAFLHSLKEQGLDAKQFYNKENGLYYVYLADYHYKEQAETAFVSNLNGKYKDEKWIMEVDNRMAMATNSYDD